jgi:phenylalanyl-tRNA synthetase beta chain
MLLSITWLTEFTPYTGSIDDLAHLLTMLGLEVEEIRYPFAHLDDFLVGRVTSCTPHPHADSLHLCSVDLGEDRIRDIVCGAPNIAADQNVAVAPVGATLPDGNTIKKVRIRGQESAGMIVSEQEMGLGEDHSGIKILPHELVPGTRLSQGLSLDGAVFDLGITPNRADCLSVLGVAREVAAACGLPLHMPSVSLQEDPQSASASLEVHIDDPKLCSLYQARVIEDISLGHSPDWLRWRLMGMGIRPINNIVDVTNYVMLELGQPLHAFDRNRVEDGKIRVARAAQDQTFQTLDGQDRTLTDEDLLIWDANRPIALAGVMGGANSEITESSTSLVLESAVFDPPTVRKTGRRLGLSSESAYRFERGVDQPGSSLALERAAQLISSLAGGRVLRDQVRAEPRPWKPVQVAFRPLRSRDLLALDVDDSFCRQTLISLGCQVQEEDSKWQVTPPSYRQDLEREVDLIEEVGRMYGMESIPATLPRINKPLHPGPAPEQGMAGYEFLTRVKAWAQGLGLTEVITYSFVGGKELDQLGLPEDDRVLVHNPLSADQDTLRTVLAPGLLRSVRTNADQGATSCRLFEVARIFSSRPDSETTVQEHTRLGLVLTGHRHPHTWPFEPDEADYQDLKGVVENLMYSFGLQRCRFVRQTGHCFLSPGVVIQQNGEEIGFLGRVQPHLAKAAHARSPIWLAELDMDRLADRYARQQTVYRPWPKFPPVHRDMTLIAGPDVGFEQIQDLIRSEAEKGHLEDVRLIDLYQPPEQLERNLTLRLRYRHPAKTLTDKEVDAEHNALGQALTTRLPLRFPST